MAKTSLLKKTQKEYLKGDVGQTKRGIVAGMMRYGDFQDRAFAYSSRWV